MKLSCPRQLLLDAAQNVQRAVSLKSSNVPALEGILLKTTSDTVTLSAYDLEIGITTTFEAEIIEKGEMIVSAKLFGDILRRLAGERLTMQTDERMTSLIIKGGNAEFSIPISPAEDFPELPGVVDGKALSFPASSIASMIRQTIYAVSQNDSRPVHTGALFEIKEGMFRVIALDGYRLAMREEPVGESEEIQFVVPGKTLSEIQKLLAAAGEEGEVLLSVGRRHIAFRIGSYEIISRLLDGEFLNYRGTIPKSSTTTVRVKVRDMVESLERASLLINDRLKSPVKCVFVNDEIYISCATAAGKVRDELSAKVTGDSVEMGFNNKYLIDALRATECDEVRIELNGPVSPMKIYPSEGESFLFLVLPIRLKNDL